jgi:hypothetical protein
MSHSKHIDIISAESRSFSFLSDRTIVVPRHNTPTEILGTLDVYTFEDPPDSTPPAAARYIASFQLLPLPENKLSIVKLSCRCDPAPSPSAQSKAPQHVRPRIYQLASSNRVLSLQITLTTVDRSWGHFEQSEGSLFVPFDSLLDAVADLYGQPEPVTPVSIAWEDWGQRTSWLETSKLHSGNDCFVYGQRVVTTKIHRDQGVDARKRPIAVLDFDPIRLRRETAPNDDGESGFQLFDPESDIIWSEPPEDRALCDMFLGGTCRANARFAVQASQIDSGQSSHSCIMIDDEHSKHIFCVL